MSTGAGVENVDTALHVLTDSKPGLASPCFDGSGEAASLLPEYTGRAGIQWAQQANRGRHECGRVTPRSL